MGPLGRPSTGDQRAGSRGVSRLSCGLICFKSSCILFYLSQTILLMFSRETRCISSVPNSASFLSSATPGFVALKTDDSNQGAFTQRLTEIKPSAESAQAIQQTEEHLKHLKLFPDGVAEKFDKHLNASNQTKADAVPVEQLGEKELLQMKFGEGIRAVLSQSKTVVSMLDEGLKGSQALDEAARLSIQLRAEIVRDVEALSHILQQEHENLGVLRRYEREQDALLKAQLGYLMPLPESRQREEEFPPPVSAAGLPGMSFCLAVACAAVLGLCQAT